MYGALAKTALGGVERAVIIVDWADSALESTQFILEAAVSVTGRAISVYDEVHPMRRYKSPKTHRQFLQRLKSVLPKGSRPLVATDAGFSCPWYCCRMYQVRAPRPAPSGPRKRCVQRAKYRQLHRAARLLALQPHHRGAGNCTRCIYAQRMQIAECFPDLRSHRRGFPLRYARTTLPDRLQAMLLVAVLETLILWQLGPAASNWRWDRHFQPTIERRRPVLSTVYLGQVAKPPLQSHSHRAARCSETPPTPRHPGGSVRMKSLGPLGREESPFVHQIDAQLRFPHHMYGRRLLLR